MNNKKRKTLTAVVATASTIAVLLSGSYAWQNYNQEAESVVTGVANPGGRLHEDFDGKNKDIYVENFADKDIYARIQITEYMEMGNDAGKNFESSNRSVDIITTGAEYNKKSTWAIHKFKGENDTNKYWTYSFGGETVYMPTFNMNKDSLVADINGTYEGKNKGDEIHYDDYVKYDVDDIKNGKEVIDIDSNDVDEGENAIEGVNISTSEEKAHIAKKTENGKVISINEWKTLSESQKETGYWVYDTDGWAYWSKPIETGTATGLLLDGLELTGTVREDWYYSMNVVAQFITADDLGRANGTGFYDTEKGTIPSNDALELLEEIGVNTLAYEKVQPTNLEDWTYTVNEDGKTVTITSYKGTDTELVIPNYIGEYAVTDITGIGKLDDWGEEIIGKPSNWDPNDFTVYSLWDESICESGDGLVDSYYKVNAYQKTITKITISEGIKTVGTSFTCSEALNTIIFPSTIIEINQKALQRCTNLTNVYMRGNDDNSLYTDFMNNTESSSATITWNYTGN